MKIVEEMRSDGLFLAVALFDAEEVASSSVSVLLEISHRLSVCSDTPQEAWDDLVEQFGEQSMKALLTEQVAASLSYYVVDKAGVIPAAPPTVKPQSPLEKGCPLEVSVRALLKPEQKLSSYDPVHVKVQPYEYDLKAAVEENLKSFALQYPRYVAAAPRDVRPEDTCLIAMKTRIDDKIVPSMTFDQQRYTLGCGLLPEEFDRNLVGMQPGETREFSFPVASDEGQGAQADTTVAVLEVQDVVYDEMDDAWVQEHVPVYGDLQGYKESIAETLDRRARRDYEQYVRGMAVATLAQRYISPIPDEIYEAKSQELISRLEEELAASNMTLDDFIQHAGGIDKFNANVMMEAREQLYQDYALDAYFRHERLEVGEKDIKEACRALDPENPNDVRALWENAGRGYVLREAAQRYCAANHLLKTALITVDAA